MNPFDKSKRTDKIHELDILTDYGGSIDKLYKYKKEFIDVNTINLNQTDDLYRFDNLDGFLTILRTKKLRLRRPHTWEDPFENFLLRGIGFTRDGHKISLEGLRNNFYASCWTLNSNCEGMWRIYRDPIAIKVKTQVNKLMDQFYDIKNFAFHSISYFIGRVNYYPEDDLRTMFSKIDLLKHLTTIAAPESLLIKRKPFSYEEEARIIFHKPNADDNLFSKVQNMWDDSDYFYVNINPNTLFEEVEIDPRIKKSQFKEIKEKIISLGYKGKIKQSILLAPLNVTINITDRF